LIKSSLLNKTFYSGKRIFVTGHTGFKGSWLSLILSELGAIARGYALMPQAGSLFEKIHGTDIIDHVEGDVRDPDHIGKALNDFQPEIVLHLAAQAIVKDCFDNPHYAFETNVMGTVNLLEAIRKCPSVKSVLVVTTDKVYENKGDGGIYIESDRLGGIDPYSASKAGMEIITECYKKSYLFETGVATGRASNVIAGGDHIQSRLIPSILNGFNEGKPVEIRNPNQTRPWQSVLDAINGYLTIARKCYEQPDEFSGAWNIGPTVDGIRTVAEVFSIMQGYFNGDLEFVQAEKLKVHESATLGLNIEKSMEYLGWRPEQSLEKMLYDVVEFYKQQKSGVIEREIARKQIGAYFDI